MRKTICLMKIITMTTILPILYGCIPGALLTNGDNSGGISAGASINTAGGGDAIAKIHNPEPMSALLFGSGFLVVSYYKSRNKRSKKK